jgi:hypothetical protein
LAWLNKPCGKATAHRLLMKIAAAGGLRMNTRRAGVLAELGKLAKIMIAGAQAKFQSCETSCRNGATRTAFAV